MFNKNIWALFFVLSVAIICILIFISVDIKNATDLFFKDSVTVISKKYSPEQEKYGIKFCVDVGATSKKSYHFSVVKDKDEELKRGNVFISYSDFDYKWVDDDEILITIYDKSQIFKQERVYNGVNISYSE